MPIALPGLPKALGECLPVLFELVVHFSRVEAGQFSRALRFIGPLEFGVIVVVIPIFSFLALYVFSGLTHLILRLLGRASGGFTATFKTFVYASTPGIFAVLPGCGPIVYWAWSTILEIVGITKAHRTTAGYATIAVLGFHFVLLCCACGLPAMVLIAALSSAGLSGP